MLNRLTLISLVVSSVLCLPRVSPAGLIGFGGDLGGFLPAIGTPALLGAGQTFAVNFNSGVQAGIGQARGTVVLRNNAAATAGDITVTKFLFESDRVANAGGINFNMNILQDFAYAGGPFIDGLESLGGDFTFTAGPQSGDIDMINALEGVILPGLADMGASGAGGFPQVDPINGMNLMMMIPAAAPINAIMGLDMNLSDNALGIGPRITLPASARLAYAGEGEDFIPPIPEPTTLALLSLGLAALGFTRLKMKA